MGQSILQGNGGNLEINKSAKLYSQGGGNYNKSWTADKDYKYIIAEAVQDGCSYVRTGSRLNSDCILLWELGFGFNTDKSNASGSSCYSAMLVKNVKKGDTFTTYANGINCYLGILELN